MAADWQQDNPAGLVGYWLLPAPPDEERLAARIRSLAAQHDAPVFQPHVTLLVGSVRSDGPQNFILDALSRQFAPFDVDASSARHSDLLFKSLFLPIDSRVIHGMHEYIIELGCFAKDEHPFDPHLSLLYKQLPERLRRELADAEPMNAARIRFDRVAAILPARGHQDFNDIAGWRTVDSRTLDGPRGRH